MSNAPRIVYTPRLGVTPEDELAALASVYAFVLQKYQKRQQATKHTPDPTILREDSGLVRHREGASHIE